MTSAKHFDRSRKLGRPPKPEDEVRNHRVVSFITEAERQKLKDLEDQSGKSLSAVVHDLLAQKLADLP